MPQIKENQLIAEAYEQILLNQSQYLEEGKFGNLAMTAGLGLASMLPQGRAQAPGAAQEPASQTQTVSNKDITALKNAFLQDSTNQMEMQDAKAFFAGGAKMDPNNYEEARGAYRFMKKAFDYYNQNAKGGTNPAEVAKFLTELGIPSNIAQQAAQRGL